MKLVMLITILSMLATNIVYGQMTREQCTDVDVRDKNPKLAEFFSKPRDQDSIGWCYAFASADLLSVEAGIPISAMHTSAVFNKSISNSFFWNTIYGLQHNIPKAIKKYFPLYEYSDIHVSGFVSKALNEAKAAGFLCPESKMPFDGLYSEQTRYLIKSLENLKARVKNKTNFEDFCSEIRFILKENQILNVDYMKLYQAMLKDQLNQGLEEMIANSCAKDNVKIPNFKTQKIYKPSAFSENEYLEKSNYFKKIGEVLESGKPLAVSYNIKHVLQAPDDGGHVSVIMARRWNPLNNKCEYKIRNSIGESCAHYQNKIDCNLSEGSYWVNEDLFYEMAEGIDYISSK